MGEDQLNDPEVYTFISEYLKGFRNDTIEFKSLQVRPNVVSYVRLVIFLYALLIAGGIISNLGVLYCIRKQPSPRNHLMCYVVNLAIINTLKCIIVLPISLLNSMFLNWIFDDRFCYILPMIQEIPLHISGWTYYVMAKHHLKQLNDPYVHCSSELMVILTWLVALVMVLPYRLYVRYIDFGKILGDHKVLKYQFKGVGMCTVKTWYGIREYFKVLFIILCLVPFVLAIWEFKMISQKLKRLKYPQVVICSSTAFHSKNSRLNTANTNQNQFTSDVSSENKQHKIFIDIRKEKISMKYLIIMLITDALFLFPLKFVRLFKLVQNNVFGVNWNYDLVFTMLIWLTFLPTSITPLLYASWQLSL